MKHALLLLIAAHLMILSPLSARAEAEQTPDRSGPETVTLELSDGLKIHGLRTGWVQIKTAHYTYRPPAFLAAVRIVTDKIWAPWLPVYAYVIEHSDVTLMVDTGPDPLSTDLAYFDCNSGNRFFYGRNLRFIVDDGANVVDQLAKVGLAPADIDQLVITHFHSDHIGMLDAFLGVELITGPGNWPHHTGAHMCVVPDQMTPPRPATYNDGPLGVFTASEKISGDGRVRLVPLPGHTPGHIGVMVQDQARYWLMAGDATFNTAQTLAGDIAGVSQLVDAARDSQANIKRQLEDFNTVLLPAHDPEALVNLDASFDRR